MKHFMKYLVIVAVVLGLSGCAAQTRTSTPDVTAIATVKGMGLMRGQLFDQANQPLANRTVRLATLYGEGATQAYIADDSGGIGGVTDASGSFAIANIPPGKYVVLVVLREGVSMALMQKNSTERIIEIKPDALFDLGPASITIPQ